MKEKSKILILGSDSQIGQSLLKKQFNNKNFIFTNRKKIDFLDNDFEKKIIKINPNLIINLVAFTNVELAEVKKKLCKQINFLAVKKIVKICEKYSIKLIHISTDYVFTNNVNKKINVNKSKVPLNYYGYTKSLAEDCITKSNINYTIVRTSWVFSIKDNNFVTKMINLACKKDNTLRVVKDEYGKPTSSTLLAKMILLIIKKLINKKNNIKKTYHVTNKGVVSRYMFSKKIMKIFFIKKKIKIKPILSKEYITLANRSKYSILDTKDFEKDFQVKLNHWEKDLKMILNKIKL